MIPSHISLKAANRYADGINAFFWVCVLVLVVYMKMAAFVFSMLFTLFVFSLVHRMLGSLKIHQKILSSLLSSIVITLLLFLVYKSFSYLLQDMGVFLRESEHAIIQTLERFGAEEGMVKNIGDLYKYVGNYLSENLGIVTNLGITVLKVILGVALGIMLFHHEIAHYGDDESLWHLTEYKIYNFSYHIFAAFKNIMTTQLLISLMNTLTISLFALLITKAYSGEFLPHWYIIIPLVTIFSLIPVIGNLMVNILIAVAALQVTPYYILVALIYFFVVHKMELIVIGKVLHKRMHVPFILILFSMIVGELLFSSMVGVILGMMLLFVLLNTLKSYKITLTDEEPRPLTHTEG